jgi:ActR/RegA family two-component response regulator
MISQETSTILFLNDDPMFEKVMVKVATKLKIALAACHTLSELWGMEGFHFDAVVIDFDMGAGEGSQAIEEIENAMGTVPIILVSGGNNADQAMEGGLRPSIKAFLPKGAGHRAILEAALSAHHMALGSD